jgi:BASS family bile acid:Na+ symporter
MSYKPGGLLLLAAMALGIKEKRKLKGYSFTAWVLVCVAAAMFYPRAFIQWGGFKLELLIVPLTQLIMFGMGTTLSPADFVRVVKSPLPVIVCMLLHYTAMPLAGYFIARLFGFDGEIAAGIVLIGSCSSGVASNLMNYLAGNNVALSITMTFFSTLAAPIVTPLLMRSLAGTFVPIDSMQMMFSILNMIIVPLMAGLAAHEILFGKRPWVRKKSVLLALIFASILFSTVAWQMGPKSLGPVTNGFILVAVLIAVIALAKLVISVLLKRPDTWIDRVLPLVSMAGICLIITVIIAQTHDIFIKVGILLLLAAILHNAIGYVSGYWGAKGIGALLGRVGFRLGFYGSPLSRISEKECRTVSIEVGMQNGGMATGLAIDVLKSYTAALPANLFGTWMNISASMLANFWGRKTVDPPEAAVNMQVTLK